MSSIFEFPKLYSALVRTVSWLNRLDNASLNSAVSGKHVLDIGCGSYQHHYNVALRASRTGIDLSWKAVRAAKNAYGSSSHAVGSCAELPFADKSFDVCLLLFVLHHLPEPLWNATIQEAARVCRESILILDHTKSDKPVARFIQSFWWNTVDHGFLYRRPNEWRDFLRDYQVKEHQALGTLFKNICFYRIDVRHDSQIHHNVNSREKIGQLP